MPKIQLQKFTTKAVKKIGKNILDAFIACKQVLIGMFFQNSFLRLQLQIGSDNRLAQYFKEFERYLPLQLFQSISLKVNSFIYLSAMPVLMFPSILPFCQFR